MELKERLKLLRATLGISTRAMSARLGLDASLWSQYESGRREPGALAIRALLKLGVNPHWLLEGHGEMWQHLPSERDDQQDVLARLKHELEVALSSPLGQKLISWQRIIQVLEQSPRTPLTEDALITMLKAEFTQEQVQASLQGLEAEGLIARSVTGYRLIKLTASDIHNEGTLQTLLAVRTLVRVFLPAFLERDFRGKVINSELEVKRGQGVEQARLLVGRVKDWIAEHNTLSANTECSEIVNLVFSIVVRKKP
ncbi:MAG: helix-turn-helix domain-containing protein [Myxococcota bacterium]